jgi:uncharacterized protein YlxP (DUF503 family)
MQMMQAGNFREMGPVNNIVWIDGVVNAHMIFNFIRLFFSSGAVIAQLRKAKQLMNLLMKKLDDRLIFRCKIVVWFELKVRPTIKKHQLTRVIFQFSVSASWCGGDDLQNYHLISVASCVECREVHKTSTLCNNRFRRFFCCFTWLDMWVEKRPKAMFLWPELMMLQCWIDRRPFVMQKSLIMSF